MFSFNRLHIARCWPRLALSLLSGLVLGLPAHSDVVGVPDECKVDATAETASLYVGEAEPCAGLLVISQAVFDEVGSEYRSSAGSGLIAGTSEFKVTFDGTEYPANLWYTGNITNMAGYFYSGSSNASVSIDYDIGNWDTSNVEDMSRMFNQSPSFSFDLNWDVSSVEDMTRMFYYSDFDGELNWESTTSNVTSMVEMFQSAASFNQRLDSWDVSNVTSMVRMFKSATSFNQSLDSWDVSKVTSMEEMFSNASQFNGSLAWGGKTSQVTDMFEMFYNAHVFEGEGLSGWDTSSVTTMNRMFYQAYEFDEEIGGWDVSNATLDNMFLSAKSFNADLNDWDVGHIESMSFMFYGATAFDGDISNWDLRNVINTSNMFDGATAFNRDIGEWNVSGVASMDAMFQNASSFNQDLSGWVVGNIAQKPTNFDTGANQAWIDSGQTPIWGADETAPIVISLSPENGATSVDNKADLIMEFSENVEVNNTLGQINIFDVTDLQKPFAGYYISSSSISFDGNLVHITLPDSYDFDFGAEYYVIVSGDAIQDASPNGNDFSGTDPNDWTFIVEPGTSASESRVSVDTSNKFHVGDEVTVEVTVRDASTTNSLVSGQADVIQATVTNGAQITDFTETNPTTNPGVYEATLSSAVPGETTVSVEVDGVVLDDTVSLTFNAVEAPGPPTDLTVTPNDAGELALSWTAPEDDGGADLAAYMYSLNGTDYISTSSTFTTHTVTNVPSGTAHEVTVKAVNTMGEQSTSSNAVKVPSVALTTGAAATVKGAFSVTATFSEAVTGFDQSDIKPYNASVDEFEGSGTTYTFTVSPSADGTVTVDVGANVASGTVDDVTGNTKATQLVRSADLTAPQITSLTTDAAAPVNAPFEVEVDFSEPVFGFDENSITLSAGSTVTQGPTPVSADEGNTQYTFEITPAHGEVTVDIAANAVQDGAGNGNAAAPQLTVEADLDAPTVTLSSESPERVSNEFSVKVTFSEEVVDFDESDITFGVEGEESPNGSVGSDTFVSLGDGAYSFTAVPTEDGTVTISIAADVATDKAGNLNTATTQSLTRTVDTVAPVPSLTLLQGTTPPVNGDFTLTLTFSEDVTSVDSNQINVTSANATVESVAATQTAGEYAILVSPFAGTDADVTVTVSQGAAEDLAGNASASTSLDVAADLVAPGATLSAGNEGDNANTLVGASFEVTATFPEAVTWLDPNSQASVDFGPQHVTVGNGTVEDDSFSGSGTTYTFVVNPNADGDLVTVDLAAGVAQDTAGNPNTAAVQLQRTADLSGPNLTLTRETTDWEKVNGAFTVLATFDDQVSWSDPSVGVVGGTLDSHVTLVSNLGDPSVYSFTIEPSNGVDTVTVEVAENVAVDSVGNGNTPAQLSLDVDTTRPQLTLALRSDYSSPVGGSFVVTAEFDEAVTDFDRNDMNPINGTVGEIISTDDGAGQAYEFEVTPSANGDVTISVAANAAYDGAGNSSHDASLTVAANLETATVALTSPTQNGDYVTGTFEVKAQFSDTVTNFTEEDVDLSTNAELETNSFSGSGDSYTFKVIPKQEADGQTITVDIAAGAATDSAGKDTAAAVTLKLSADLTVPTPELTVVGEQGEANVGSSFQVRVDFGEAVTGFGDPDTDLSVTNATLGTIETGEEDGVYTFAVNPSTHGSDVTVEVLAGVAADQAGNVNAASNQLRRTPDLEGPTVDLTMQDAGASGTYVNGPFGLVVTFSEVVTGFEVTDLSLTNVTIDTGTFAQDASDLRVYTLTATPLSDDEVEINIAEGVAQDSVGNPNAAASNPLTRTADTTAPIVELSAPSVIGAAPFTVTVTFSEGVTGFDDPSADVIVTGATVDSSSLQETIAGREYTFALTPEDQDVTVSIAAGTVADAAGNTNSEVETLTRTADLSAPTVIEFETASDGPFNGPFSLSIKFSEDVSGFEDGDVAVTDMSGSATLGSITGSGDTYSLIVTPGSTGDTTLTFDVAADVATDGAGNGNIAAQLTDIKVDTTAPGITLKMESGETGTTGLTVGGSSFKVIATLTEEVEGFDIGHVSVVNGTLSAALVKNASDPREYSFDVTPIEGGTVSVYVGEGVFEDAAGNANTASGALSVTANIGTFDVTLATDVTGTVTGDFTLTATFAEAVSTGFDDVSHISVGNGTVNTSPTKNSDTEYTFVVRPASDGLVTVYVNPSVATDSFGNFNAVSNSVEVSADVTAPMVALELDEGVETVTGEFTVTATFTEAVSDFSQDDISVTNGAVAPASLRQESDQTFKFEVEPETEGDIIIQILDQAVQDDAGNLSAAASLTVQFEEIAAAVLISDTALRLTEGETDTSLSLVLATQPTATVTLTFATNPSDLITVDSELTFDTANWDAPQSLTIKAHDDSQFGDQNTTLTVSTTSDDPDYGSLSSQDLSITVEDTDVAAFVINPSPATVTEASSGTFAVALETEPASTVELALGSSNPSILTVSDGAKLTFSTSNWDTPQTVTLTAANNDSIGDAEASISLIATGAEYDGLSASVRVLITDDDVVPQPEDSGAAVSSLVTSEVMANQLGSVLSDAVAGGLSTPRSSNGAPTRMRRSMFGLNASDYDPDAYNRLFILSAREGEEGFTLVDWFSLGVSQTVLDAELSGDGTFAYAMLGTELTKTATSVDGLLYGAETSSWDYDEETDVDRTGFSIGYYKAERRDGLTYSGSAVVTFTQNNFVNTLNATGDAASRRLILKGSVSGDALRDEIEGALRGYADLMYATEALDAFTFSNGTTSAKNTTNIGRIGVGLEYTTVPDERGGRFLVRGELSQVFGADDVTLSDGQVYSPNEAPVGAVTFGWITRPGPDTSAQVEVTFGELGNDQKQEIRLDGNVDRRF